MIKKKTKQVQMYYESGTVDSWVPGSGRCSTCTHQMAALLREMMCIYFKNNIAKFHPDPI